MSIAGKKGRGQGAMSVEGRNREVKSVEGRNREIRSREGGNRERRSREGRDRITKNGEIKREEIRGSRIKNKQTMDEETGGFSNGYNNMWEEARCLVPEVEERNRVMAVIREEIAGKNVRYAPSGRELLVIELQYISPFFWLLQGMLIAGLLFLFYMIPHRQRNLAEHMCMLSVAAAWMGVITCSDLGRHISRGMAELEQSCYFNLPQMWTMRMILTGVVDILFLTLCSGRIAVTASTPLAQVCVYVLVPFVLSNVCCLLLFSFMRGGRGRYGQLAMAFLAGMIAVIPSANPSWYQIEFLGIWIGVLLAGVLLFLWQVRNLYGKMTRGEIICWN